MYVYIYIHIYIYIYIYYSFFSNTYMCVVLGRDTRWRVRGLFVSSCWPSSSILCKQLCQIGMSEDNYRFLMVGLVLLSALSILPSKQFILYMFIYSLFTFALTFVFVHICISIASISTSGPEFESVVVVRRRPSSVVISRRRPSSSPSAKIFVLFVEVVQNGNCPRPTAIGACTWTNTLCFMSYVQTIGSTSSPNETSSNAQRNCEPVGQNSILGGRSLVRGYSPAA